MRVDVHVCQMRSPGDVSEIASLFDHVDLDGNLLLAEDPWPGVELVDGVQLPPDSPGLGVTEAIPDPR